MIFILQYTSALVNLNENSSPAQIPVPFNNTDVERPFYIPVFKEIGEPITNTTTNPDIPGQVFILPTVWTFYLGFLVSTIRIHQLWVDAAVILILNIFFLYFYSTLYELDITLNSKGTIYKTLKEIDDQTEEKINQTFRNSSVASSQLSFSKISDSYLDNQASESFKEKKTKGYYDAMKYVDRLKNKMFLPKFYDGLSTVICSTSSIITLILLLMISFQIKGLVNLFYVCYCLWFISKSMNFVYQRNWRFPTSLQKVLKPFVIFELLIQFAFQVPFRVIHRETNDLDGWQGIIGLVRIWDLDDDNLPYLSHMSNLVLKCIMFALILIQQNIFNSEEYEVFIRSKLAEIRSFSDRKAESMAYLYNNRKLRITMENSFEKDKMMRKLGKNNNLTFYSPGS